MTRLYITAIIALLTLAACQKEDDNGKLGGYWKIVQIDDFASATVTDATQDDRFWGIQLDLLEIRTTPLTAYYYRFRNTGDSLFIKATGHDKDLKAYGVYNNADERYAIEQLTDKRMTLCSKNAKIRFRKF